MKVICAYLLACLGGNSSPSETDLKNILASVGIEPDEDRLELFMSQVSGKSIEDVIASGRQKLASVPSGGGGGGGGVAVASAPAGGGAAAAEPAKEEKKVEEKEESDDDMGFSLFD